MSVSWPQGHMCNRSRLLDQIVYLSSASNDLIVKINETNLPNLTGSSRASPCENHFRTSCPAGFQCSVGHSDPLPFSPLITSKYYVLCRTFAGHFPCTGPCRTKCPAMFEPLPDISRSLSDMSGILREDWQGPVLNKCHSSLPIIKDVRYSMQGSHLLWLNVAI